jgi:hypothetical protein
MRSWEVCSLEKQKIPAYFGHHKCASTFLLNVIREVCKTLGFKHAHFHSPKMWGHESGYTLDKMVDARKLDFVSYINADLDYIGDLDRFRGIHIIRDPRDIVVSSYFSHRNSHPTGSWPELAALRKVLERLPEDEGILEDMRFTASLPVDGWTINLFDTMKEWNYCAGNVMELRFEDLVRDPYQHFLEMLEFLGLVEYSDATASSLLRYAVRKWQPQRILRFQRRASVPAWALLMIVYQNRFSKLADGRTEGDEDQKSHHRKGLAGDWMNHFKEQHKRYFKEHYNDLLVKLGYEKDNDW